jgi:hypothetical protein
LRRLDLALATALITLILAIADIRRAAVTAGDAIDAPAREFIGRERGSAKAGQSQGRSKDGQFDQAGHLILLNEHAVSPRPGL